MFKRKISELESIIDKYQDMLFQFAYFRVGSFDVAQDIVQELFIKLFQKESNLQKIKNIKGYLLKSIQNRCVDYHRQNKWDKIPIESAHKKVTDESQQHYYNDFITIEQILSPLPYEQAEVIRMHFVDNLTFVEISSILDISVNSVKSRYRYGIEKLRKTKNFDNYEYYK